MSLPSTLLLFRLKNLMSEIFCYLIKTVLVKAIALFDIFLSFFLYLIYTSLIIAMFSEFVIMRTTGQERHRRIYILRHYPMLYV